MSTDEAVQIVGRYGHVLTESKSDRLSVIDVSQLVDPKQSIMRALLLMLSLTSEPEARKFLKSAVVGLAFFQPRVGDAASPLDAMGPDQRTWRGIVEEEMKRTTMLLQDLER